MTFSRNITVQHQRNADPAFLPASFALSVLLKTELQREGAEISAAQEPDTAATVERRQEPLPRMVAPLPARIINVAMARSCKSKVERGNNSQLKFQTPLQTLAAGRRFPPPPHGNLESELARNLVPLCPRGRLVAKIFHVSVKHGSEYKTVRRRHSENEREAIPSLPH